MISKQWQRKQMRKLGHQLPRNWTPPPKKKEPASVQPEVGGTYETKN